MITRSPYGTKKVLSATDKQRLGRAISIAKTSQSKARHGTARHGAVIIAGGRTISTGVNIDRNDPRLMDDNAVRRKYAAVHAEVAAIRNAGRGANLKGATIYVARVTRTDTPAMSKPCATCQEMLRERGIKKVVYTIDSEMEL